VLSETIQDHFLNPRNAGVLENADGVGTEGSPGAGNFMVIAVRLRAGVIEEAKFQTYGCAGAIAAGSCLTEWITGRTVVEAAAITAAELNARLGGLPLGKEHCASLAVAALRRALKDAGGGAVRR
jgi:NifU-like protein involved in Fe-S cluster formation